MYFLPRSAPLDLSADQLRGLRLSLNTPVVSIEEVPVEPARAAIAIHDEIDGRPNVTVGVYALRSGVAVLFSFEEPLRDNGALTTGIDTALSFGESMGFLFDEDELESDYGEEARSRALDLWYELMSPPSREPERDPQTTAVSAAPGPDGDAEAVPQGDGVLLLEEVADSEEDLPGVRVEEPDGVDFPPPVLLSKFRHLIPGPSSSPYEEEARPDVEDPRPASKRAALGRLKLVKRRQGGSEAPSRPSVIRRLLSSF